MLKVFKTVKNSSKYRKSSYDEGNLKNFDDLLIFHYRRSRWKSKKIVQTEAEKDCFAVVNLWLFDGRLYQMLSDVKAFQSVKSQDGNNFDHQTIHS